MRTDVGFAARLFVNGTVDTKRISRTRRRAFTLAEAVVVMLILAIISVIAVPRYWDTLDMYQVEAAAKRVKLDLELARRHARTVSASQTVAFDSLTATYALTGMASLDHPGSDYSVDLSRSPYSSALLSADFAGDESVVFDGFGVPDSNGVLTVESGAYSRVVSLSQSGRVTIE